MKVSWYWHRLKAMSAGELGHRVFERWKHRSDASFARRVAGVSCGAATSGIPALPFSGRAPELLKHRLADDARHLLAGRWHLFGWRSVELGLPPAWHRDPLGGRETPRDRLAHQLDHRALPAGGDVRTLWEFSRWSEVVRVAMHGWLNGDPAAIAAAQGWLENWVQENPTGYGIHWTSPLEAGLRLINFTWFDALVHEGGSDELRERQRHLAERVVVPHVLWVWRYLSFGSSANNHLLGELAGLLHAVKRWPALVPHVVAPEKLWARIEGCVLDQFAPDGGNREQALHYHLFAWEMAWHAARLMQVNHGPARDLLLKAGAFFAHMVHAAEPWHYGDSDDAEVVPLCLDRSRAEGEWQAWWQGNPDGETLAYWLGCPPATWTPRSGWWLAPESGMAVWGDHGWRVRVDASPLGFGAMAAHGHGDALHVSLWDGDEAIVIDPGTGGYYGMKEQRAALAAWTAHNGPQPVEGFRTPRRLGTFLLLEHHQPPVTEVQGGRMTVRLRHEGRDWTRSVEINGPTSVDVDDQVSSGSMRTRWHLAPEVGVEPLGEGAFLLRRGRRVWQVCFGGAASCRVLSGTASRRYGHFEPCPVIEVTGELRVKSVWSRG